MDILCPTEGDRKDYLVSPGLTPFFAGLELVPTPTLCHDFRERLKPLQTDDKATKDYKKALKANVWTVIGTHKVNDVNITRITKCPKAAKKFLQVILKRCVL